MDAIILAAGLGTRLRPHTLTTPKPLLPVRGRPILDWTLAALPPQVKRLVVVTHHLAEQVEAFLKQQTRFADWRTVFQARPQGTGDAFTSCRGHISGESVLVLNGDDLYAASDLAKLAAVPAGLLVREVDEPRKFGICFTKPDGTLEKLVEKPDLDGRLLANLGAYHFPAGAINFDLPLSPRGEYEITDVVNLVLATQPVQPVRASAWLPIGDEAQWRAADALDLDTMLA